MVTDDTGARDADDNVIQTFRLESSNLRGRVIRLGSVLNEIIGAHAYPNQVSHLVAETVTLSLLLSSMLKYKGIFTLQTSGDGPVTMLVSDVTLNGEAEAKVRGCAAFDGDRMQYAVEPLSAMKTRETSQNHLAQLLGKGYIAFTVDQGEETDRYQGIVELKGASLVDCVQHYFTQSEQIGTGIKMAVGQREGRWRAGAVMLQTMPEGRDAPQSASGNLEEDDWRRAMILMDSCTEDEFLDPDLHSNALLTRLFHEEGVRVYEPRGVVWECRCSEEKVENVLRLMPPEDREYMTVEEKISMRCEFCSRDFVFDAKEFERKIARKPGKPPAS